MEATLLKAEDIWGKQALQVFFDYGELAGFSDLPLILGSQLADSSDYDDAVSVINNIWTSSQMDNSLKKVCVVLHGSEKAGMYADFREGSYRPILSAESTAKIKPFMTKEIMGKFSPLQVCEYGFYPQQLAKDHLILEAAYQEKALKMTGKTYTFDTTPSDSPTSEFHPLSHPEFCYQDKRYVRVAGNLSSPTLLSNGDTVDRGKIYWLEVQPIEWLMDKSGVWIAKNVLFSGIQFDTKSKYNGDFSQTMIKRYLDTYFINEMRRERPQEISLLQVRNELFANYVSGIGNNKTFTPQGKDGNPFTPEQAKRILSVTNYAPYMRDMLKLIATFPKEKQMPFRDVVLATFEEREQPNGVLIFGKKLAIAGGYEEEFNNTSKLKSDSF